MRTKFLIQGLKKFPFFLILDPKGAIYKNVWVGSLCTYFRGLYFFISSIKGYYGVRGLDFTL